MHRHDQDIPQDDLHDTLSDDFSDNEIDHQPRKRRRISLTKSKAKAIHAFWNNLPKPLRWFVTAFAFLWLAGIAAQIIRGEFDPIQTLMHFCRAMLAFVGLV